MASQSEPAAAGNDADETGGEPPLPQRSRAAVMRDVLVFQLKLFVDGLRDVILSPVSLVLGIVGVFVSRQPGEPFYRLLRAGRASENWIDLFGAAFPDESQPVAQKERAQQIQREFEAHLRGLEESLKDADYTQAARTNARRLRTLWKRHVKRGASQPGEQPGEQPGDQPGEQARTPPDDKES